MKTILLSIILISSALFGNCQTIIPGGSISGTWTMDGSPYIIQGAIMIPNDSTLTIEPGVMVEFQGSYKFLVLGRLLAMGNPTDSIIITATDTTNGWLGIRFENTASTNDTSKIEYCKIQYGKAIATSPNDCGGAFYFNNFSKAIISNSLISNCAADSDGGGIYCLNSSPYISNNSILNNNAFSAGGGIYCNNSSPLIIDNTISDNIAMDGAAIACRYSSNPSITNNIISNNTAPNSCGGIRCDNSSPIISDNTISYNTANMGVCTVSAGGIVCFGGNQLITNNTITNNSAAGNGGGGIYCANSTTDISNNTISNNTALNVNSGGGIKCGCGYCNVSITNNIISNNISSFDGGGIYCASDDVTISYNIIANNTAAIFGGGVFCHSHSPDISNNVISNNTADSGGGGISCSGSTGNFNSNTISNNSAQYGGALYCTSSSNPTIQNTIFWGNTATAGNQIYLDDDGSDPDFYYCDVQGGIDAFGLNSNVFYLGIFENNIDSVPFFISPSGGSGSGFNGVTADWSLQSTSPCINAGNPTGTYPEFDIAGNPRVIDDLIDIGAYEYQGYNHVIHNYIQDQIIIYPNPFINFTTIYIKNNSDQLQLSIYDMYGKRIKLINNISGDKIKIERENLISGIYFYELKQETGDIFTGKIIITD